MQGSDEHLDVGGGDNTTHPTLGRSSNPVSQTAPRVHSQTLRATAPALPEEPDLQPAGLLVVGERRYQNVAAITFAVPDVAVEATAAANKMNLKEAPIKSLLPSRAQGNIHDGSDTDVDESSTDTDVRQKSSDYYYATGGPSTTSETDTGAVFATLRCYCMAVDPIQSSRANNMLRACVMKHARTCLHTFARGTNIIAATQKQGDLAPRVGKDTRR